MAACPSIVHVICHLMDKTTMDEHNGQLMDKQPWTSPMNDGQATQAGHDQGGSK